MKKNMSNSDRIIRLLLIAVVIGLYYFGIIAGTLAIVLFVVSAILLLTTFVNFCPLYRIFGISTCKT